MITPRIPITPQAKLPRVSVVMPVYNGEAHLDGAIESVLAQTLRDLELVVVDDGSTDTTSDILRTLGERDDRLVVLSQEHHGITHSRNHGFSIARGEYIAVHDADDLSLTDRLETQVAFLDQHPDFAMVGSAVQWIDDLGNPIPGMGYPLDDEEIRQKLYTQSCFVHGAVLFRHSCVSAAGGYREEFPLAEDVDLYLRLSERYFVANLPDVLYQWRRSEQSVSIRHMGLLVKYFKVAVEMAQQRQSEGRDLLGASFLRES